MNIYGRQSDFFYSGHIGFALMTTMESYTLKAYKCTIYGVFTTVFVGFTLLTFRVHYSIDLFTGLVMAHYCYSWAGKISRHSIFQSICEKYVMPWSKIRVSMQEESNHTNSRDKLLEEDYFSIRK
mmetsp:Transcript_299/g.330  ORF Transcript_299/g.330 Transcript_299/m.330 type:complete len:125 (-) Transcript_299:35-409(-)